MTKPTLPNIKPHSLQAWLSFMRPKTFWIAAVPVFVGSALTLALTGTFNLWVCLLTLFSSIAIQALSNMQNDYGYNKKKAENGTRKGLPRATTEGWISMEAGKRMIIFMLILCSVLGAALICIGGWPILIIAVLSVLCAYCYMGGPLPIAYTPFGELLVLIFYGWFAVGGTFWLQTHQVSGIAVCCGTALGLIGAAVLYVNNFRDIDHDISVGRKTLAAFTGRKAGIYCYSAMIYLPFIVIGWLASFKPEFWPLLFTLIVLPRAAFLPKQLEVSDGYTANAVMFNTIKLELLFGLLLTASAIAIFVLNWPGHFPANLFANPF